ncbi:MAG: hypothetical protein AAFN77_05425 [Planctomycetota bacterium]
MNRIFFLSTNLIAWAIVLALASCTIAQDATPVLVVDGLNNPTSVAIHPATGDVFVAESGSQRVVRIVDRKPQPVIVDFGKDAFGKDPIYTIGPLSLLFLNDDVLVVGGGGHPDGEDLIYGFNLPKADASPVNADDAKLGKLTLASKDEVPAEGDFFAMAKGSKGIYVTCNGDDKKGWIARAIFNQEYRLTGLTRNIATVDVTQTTAPMAITISPQGHVVVGQMGKTEKAKDSLLCFYSEEGAHLDTFKLGMFDITGLAYGPKHGRLFATDFSWTDPKQGGLYKIIATKTDQGCKAKLMQRLERPTSLAFAKNGDLYVTLAGDPSAEKPDGKLIVFKEMDIDLTR